MARLMRSISIPRPNTSVATQMRLLNSLNSLYRLILLSVRKWDDERIGRCVPFFLADAGMHGDAREVAFTQQLIEFCCAKCAFDEDDDLVELEVVEQIVELTVLLALA